MNHEELIQHLRQSSHVRLGPGLEAVFRNVDRAAFVPSELRDEAYEDYPLPIGFGATISQPTTVAFMLERLDAREGQNALDIGSGSGWTTALLAHLAGRAGKVIGLEIIPSLVKFGSKNLRAFYSTIPQNIGVEMAPIPEIRLAEKGRLGLSEEAPFDRILVSAAANALPQELVRQLAKNGRMVIPIRDAVWLLEKRGDDEPRIEKFPGFTFVPLVA
jgi:protein-L-isoaspartate(D-aspartate) O-methyltransferase